MSRNSCSKDGGCIEDDYESTVIEVEFVKPVVKYDSCMMMCVEHSKLINFSYECISLNSYSKDDFCTAIDYRNTSSVFTSIFLSFLASVAYERYISSVVTWLKLQACLEICLSFHIVVY